jgi:hypothetical protein
MTDTEDFVEVMANDIDEVQIKDHDDVDDKVSHGGTTPFDDFLYVYRRLRAYYGDDVGLTTVGTLPRVDDIKNLYEGVNLSQELLLQRRWMVASELALLDIMVRDMVAIQKYLGCTEDQQYLTRAVDHFTKDEGDDKWDISKWSFVIVYKSNEDKYALGKTAIYEDEVFHYRFCRDFTYAELFVTKFSESDLGHMLLAPLNTEAFAAP